MGKFFCKLGNKWCKLLKKNNCTWNNNNVNISMCKDCPKRVATRTVSFKELLMRNSFDDIMTSMLKYWPEQEKNTEGYRNVYNEMLKKRSKAIHGYKIIGHIETFANDSCCPIMSAESTNISNPICYAIDGFAWNNVNYMDIASETLSTMSECDIIAGVLYELTFNGYTEEKVAAFYERMEQNFLEMIENENG